MKKNQFRIHNLLHEPPRTSWRAAPRSRSTTSYLAFKFLDRSWQGHSLLHLFGEAGGSLIICHYNSDKKSAARRTKAEQAKVHEVLSVRNFTISCSFVFSWWLKHCEHSSEVRLRLEICYSIVRSERDICRSGNIKHLLIIKQTILSINNWLLQIK